MRHPGLVRRFDEDELQGWRARILRVIGPSWLGSLSTHALIATLCVFAAQSPSCRRDPPGERVEEFRTIGIRSRDTQNAPVPAAAPVESVAQDSSHDTPPPDPQSVAAPSAALSLPQLPRPEQFIGGGAPTFLPVAENSSLVQPSPAGQRAETLPPTPGGTSFLGIEDVGRSFVYVIDRSFSMAADNALEAAKSELQASLQRLNGNQEFQIIFYNNEFIVLQPRNERALMFKGTDTQRQMVSDQLLTIRPAGGTQHFPALMRAFDFQPDVIYLLTDGAAESALSRQEIEQLKRRNRGGARIHCVEFGQGPQSPLGEAGNFLKDLARATQGQYIYRNTSAGGRR